MQVGSSFMARLLAVVQKCMYLMGIWSVAVLSGKGSLGAYMCLHDKLSLYSGGSLLYKESALLYFLPSLLAGEDSKSLVKKRTKMARNRWG